MISFIGLRTNEHWAYYVAGVSALVYWFIVCDFPIPQIIRNDVVEFGFINLLVIDFMKMF